MAFGCQSGQGHILGLPGGPGDGETVTNSCLLFQGPGFRSMLVLSDSAMPP